MNNPLMSNEYLPEFNRVKTSDIEDAMPQLIKETKEKVEEALMSDAFGFQNFFLEMGYCWERFGRIWGVVSHLHQVKNDDELREVYAKWVPEVIQFMTKYTQDERYFEKVERLLKSDEFQKLNKVEQYMVSEAHRKLVRAGAKLKGEAKERYQSISQELSKLSMNFSNNVMDDSQNYELIVTDVKELEGIPQNTLEFFQELAKEAGHDNAWKITLDMPCYLPVLQYSKNRALREKLYRAYIQRASSGEKDNTQNMFDILRLRQERIQLLGYNTFADYSIDGKMAESVEDVVSFLEDLHMKSIHKATDELKALETFAKKKDDLDDLKHWDMAYYSEKLKEEKYSYSSEEVREYFPKSKVVEGVFEVVRRLFKVSFKLKKVSTWHEDVEYYEVLRGSEVVGGIYFDLYARKGKSSGAWMDEVIAKYKKTNGQLVQPVAYLVCNFTPPSGNEESLLRFDDVLTVFHEMGHVLHHILTEIDYLGISGINGVPWDAVELPSQFLENWCWMPEVLKMMSKHHKTGKNIPDELIEKMLASRNFHSAMGLVRQLVFSLMDMKIHHTKVYKNTSEMKADIRSHKEKYMVRKPLEGDAFENSFLHIFSGGYAAGYYSYKWAEVLSADCFMEFKNNGIFNETIAFKFYDIILSKGGSGDFMGFFERFMGRKPKIDALLELTGVK